MILERGTSVERFAPSPTGPAHLGHAYSALRGFEAARAAGGRFLLRMEDLDSIRSRPEWEAALCADLGWLGLSWETPILRQSARAAAYGAALDSLRARGLVYPCLCTRKDVAAALSAPQESKAAQGSGLAGPDGPPYPGICRLHPADPARLAREPYALRLDMRRALAALEGAALDFVELEEGPQGETGLIRVDPEFLVEACGDVVLARKEAPASYHLAVTVDDAFQGVTHVTRGRDLFAATPIHRLLQALLGLPKPLYRHHRLIRDAQGRRLAKRDGDRSLSALRAEGWTPEDVRRAVGLV